MRHTWLVVLIIILSAARAFSQPPASAVTIGDLLENSVCTEESHMYYLRGNFADCNNTTWTITGGIQGVHYIITSQSTFNLYVTFKQIGTYYIRAVYNCKLSGSSSYTMGGTPEMQTPIRANKTTLAVQLNGPNSIYYGDVPTYTANVSGTGPFTYSWSVNSSWKQNTTTNTFSPNYLLNQDVISVSVTSSAACVQSNSSQKTITVTANPNNPGGVVPPAPPSLPDVTGNTCSGRTLTRGTPPDGVIWYWQGTDPNGRSTANSSVTYSVNASGNYYLRAKRINAPEYWSDATEIKVDIDPVDISYPSYSIKQARATRSITLTNGFTVKAGQEFSAKIVISDECNNFLNWSEEIIYDQYSQPISRNRVYLDAFGNPLQTQSVDYITGKIWASQPLYDNNNTAAASTLPAPILQNDFMYQKKFVTNSSNGIYTASDFDRPVTSQNSRGERNNPAPVGKESGTLGWYYSSANNLEPMTPTTSYPYSRTYTPAGANPTETISAGPGDQYKMGSTHEVKSERKKITAGELDHYASLQSHFPGASVNVTGYKFITNDPTNTDKKAVSFVDAAGRGIASATLIGTTYDNWSYNYYNDMGQLIASVAPQGINTASQAEPSFVTQYYYDQLGRLIETSTPDEGRTKYVYSKDGKIRFSQNNEQGSQSVKRFSYTNYDRLGRLIESGEYTSDGANPFNFDPHSTSSLSSNSILSIVDNIGFTGVSFKIDEQQSRISDYTIIEYDEALDLPTDDPLHAIQNNLNGQVAKTWNANSTTWYSYDEFGQLEWTKQLINGLGVYKTIDYSYDYFGNVTEVVYQKGTPSERFYHHYEYDKNQRLVKVYTSTDGNIKTLRSAYYYYLHGPLKRVELGGNLQGIDYVYNIDGSLKLINHADPALDPGQDGISGVNSGFQKDLFGEVLDYHADDYTGAGYNEGNLSISGYPDQFGGAVKAVRWHNHVDSHQPRAYAFNYDNLYQLDKATFGNVTGAGGSYNFGANTAQAYQEDIGDSRGTYDKNGNIYGLVRKGKTGNTFQSYTYNYKTNTNQLESIVPQGGGSSLLSYQYNTIGQLIRQVEGGKTMNISYNAYGLVEEIRNEDNNLVLAYTYDDKGNLLSKTTYDGSANTNVQLITFYVSDAGGNVVGIYTKDATREETAFTMTEVPVYGAGRIAVYKPRVSTVFYEVSDHLGNVRAVIGSPAPLTFTATMEDNGVAAYSNPRVQEMEFFKNLSVTARDHNGMNHTEANGSIPSPQMSAYLKWIDGQTNTYLTQSTGPAINLRVEPGDKITVEVYAKFRKKTSYARDGIVPSIASILATNFVGTASGIDVISKAVTEFGEGTGALFALTGGAGTDTQRPYAFLNALVYDKTFNLNQNLTTFTRIPETAGFDPGYETLSGHQKMEISTITITEPGYVYIYVSNESQDTDVWFDDLKITHVRANVVAGADYYPFGLAMENREITREDYRYGYQGQYSEEDKTTGWNEFELRMYDARIGRWISPDPYGQFASPYLAMGNMPHMGSDPDGGWCCGGAGIMLPEVVVTASRISATSIVSAAATTTMAAMARGSGGYQVEFNLNYPTGDLGNISTSSYPSSSQLQQWESNLTGLPKPNTAELTSGLNITPPSFGESLIPVWGSGREAAAAFSAGSYWKGAAYTALAISDVFLVKAAVTAVVRGGVTLAARYALKRAVANPQMTVREAAAAVRVPQVASMMQGKGVDRAFRFYANRNWVLGPAQRMGIVTLNPMNRGADMVGRRLLNGTWWDVTTRGAWQSHVLKYGPGGIPLIY